MIRRILPTFGVTLITFGMTFMLPLAISIIGDDGAGHAFWPALLIAAFLGLILVSPAIIAREMPSLMPRDGMLLVALCWTLLPALAALPLIDYFQAAGKPISWSFAYFEAVSGLTTTGATVITGLDDLPYAINFWRCFLQWIGGMGILILAVAILPLVSAGAGSIFKAESTGPLKEAKLTPRIAQTAKGLWGVYAAISLACFFAYWAAGMSFGDAWLHMFSTMSLGGLSSHDSSFGFFNSPTLEWIAIFFMLISTHIYGEKHHSLTILLGSSLLITALLLLRGVYSDPWEALRAATFSTVSIGSTTGYATVDYTTWPIFAPVLILMLSGVATSAGSTGAGIKMARLIILIKQTRREVMRMLHPRAVNPLMINGEPVANGVIFAALAFMLVYGGTILVLTGLLLLTDMPLDTAFSAIIATVNNAGPGLNEIGPAGNFSGLTALQLNICSAAMILGRLEMMSILAIFTVEFWRE